MKKFSKILTLVLTVLLVLSNARAVHADPSTPPTAGVDSKYTPVDGPANIEFKKFLITELGQELPQDYTFTYKVTPGEAVAGKAGKPEYWTFGGVDYYVNAEAVEAAKTAVVDDAAGTTGKWIYNGEQFDDKDAAEAKALLDIKHTPAVEGNDDKFEVFAGPDADKVTVTDAVFLKTDDGTDDMIPVKDKNDNLELKEGEEVYSRRTVKIDFSQVKFDEPGVYRYILTEEYIDAEGIHYDTQAATPGVRTRVIDVYVVDKDDDSETLEIRETVLHELTSNLLLTDDMGSQDENINDTIATKFDIVDIPEPYKTNPGVEPLGYDTYDLANEARAAIREKIHDDLVTQWELIDEDVTQTTDVDPKTALDGDPLNQAVYNTRQVYLKELDDAGVGDATTAATTAANNLAAKHAAIAGKLAELIATSNPAEVKALRAEIDSLRGELPALETALADAEAALETANSQVAAALAAYNAALANKKVVTDKIIELRALYDRLGSDGIDDDDDCIVPIAWKLADKSDNFVNEVDPLFRLQFHKKVTGNQGSRDKYFKFNLKLEELDAHELVTIDEAHSKWTKAPTKNEATNYASSVMKKANDVKDADPDSITYADAKDDDDYLETLFIFHDGNTVYFYDPTHTKNPSATDADKTENVWYADNTVDDTLDAYVVAPIDTAKYEGMPGLQLKANDAGVLEYTFYLKHDEWIRLINLNKGVKYTVTEEAEDYKSAEFTDKLARDEEGLKVELEALQEAIDAQNAIATDTSGAYTQAQKDAAAAARDILQAEFDKLYVYTHKDATTGTLDYHKFTGYTNTRNGIIPTGVMAAAGTGALILGAGIIGLVALGRRKEEEEDE